jgi:hypothetical protein
MRGSLTGFTAKIYVAKIYVAKIYVAKITQKLRRLVVAAHLCNLRNCNGFSAEFFQCNVTINVNPRPLHNSWLAWLDSREKFPAFENALASVTVEVSDDFHARKSWKLDLKLVLFVRVQLNCTFDENWILFNIIFFSSIDHSVLVLPLPGQTFFKLFKFLLILK